MRVGFVLLDYYYLCSKTYSEKAKDLTAAASQFRDGSFPMTDPRQEAAEVLLSMASTLTKDWSNDLADASKLNGSLFNTMLAMRR